MSEFIVKVGTKGELYTPKKLRLAADITPGSQFIATVKNHEIILHKRKTVLDILDEDAVATVTIQELKQQRKQSIIYRPYYKLISLLKSPKKASEKKEKVKISLPKKIKPNTVNLRKSVNKKKETKKKSTNNIPITKDS